MLDRATIGTEIRPVLSNMVPLQTRSVKVVLYPQSRYPSIPSHGLEQASQTRRSSDQSSRQPRLVGSGNDEKMQDISRKHTLRLVSQVSTNRSSQG